MVKLVRTDMVKEAGYTDVRVDPRHPGTVIWPPPPPPASAAGMSSSGTTLGT